MITVVLPTRNPHQGRLARTLAGLAAQTLPPAEWEMVLVDNGSEPALSSTLVHQIEIEGRIIVERRAGLTPARLAGILAARGEVIVFVDDDNVLNPDYIQQVAANFAGRPALGAAGGPVVPEWETTPPDWTREFHGLLALRDFGSQRQLAVGGPQAPWPTFAPVGAGLAVRSHYARKYARAVSNDPRRSGLDRKGNSLASGGDNDLVFTVLHSGGDVGYFPDLRLTHLIPNGRLGPDYLARLNRGIMRSWVNVLALHGQCPWRALSPASVWLRVTRAFFRARVWQGPAARIRWAGMVGQFEGQADLKSRKKHSTGSQGFDC